MPTYQIETSDLNNVFNMCYELLLSIYRSFSYHYIH